MDLKELYQDIILEHGKEPQKFWKMHMDTIIKQKGTTHLCGDQVQVYLKLNENKACRKT